MSKILTDTKVKTATSKAAQPARSILINEKVYQAGTDVSADLFDEVVKICNAAGTDMFLATQSIFISKSKKAQTKHFLDMTNQFDVSLVNFAAYIGFTEVSIIESTGKADFSRSMPHPEFVELFLKVQRDNKHTTEEI